MVPTGKGSFLASLTAITLASVTLSGCFGSNDDGAEKNEDLTAPTVGSDSTGAVSGSVLDDELRPIQDAQVGLRGSTTTTRTDGSGRFVFKDVEPGKYTLDAAKLGYEPTAKHIEVKAGQVSKADLTLLALPSPDTVFYEVTTFTGFYDCAMGAVIWVSACSYPYTAAYLGARDGICPGAFVGDPHLTPCSPPVANLSNYGAPEDLQKNEFRYNFTVKEGAVDIVSEMEWTAASAASKKMFLTLDCWKYDPVADDCALEDGRYDYADVEGESPLRVQWSAKGVTTKPDWVMARGYLPFYEPQLAFGQKFVMWNTVFYGTEAPEGFTILDPDA